MAIKPNKMTGLPRPHISWSQISSLKWSKEQYKQSYIYGKRQDSPYLTLGKAFAEAMEHREKKVPKYIDIIRQQIPDFPEKEVEMTAEISEIPIIGYYDAFDEKKETIIEFKTGKSPSHASWRGQLTLYSLLYFQKYKAMPKSVVLYWAKTMFNDKEQLIFAKDKVQKFHIKITLEETIQFVNEIKNAYQKIKELCEFERMQFGRLPFEK